MVKVTDVASVDNFAKKAVVSLMADQKSDVSAGMDIKGMLQGYTPDFGSSVLTASGELAFLKSDGTWNWV